MPQATKSILTLSMARVLTGATIESLIDQNWEKIDDATRARFDNVGFNVDPSDIPKLLNQLRTTVQERPWDGVLIGWCCRGYPERTELFEELVATCIESKSPHTKLIFNTGPQNLADPVLRNFP